MHVSPLMGTDLHCLYVETTVTRTDAVIQVCATAAPTTQCER